MSKVELKEQDRLTIDELTSMVSELSGMTKKDTKIVLTSLGNVAIRELRAGRKVYIPEIGALTTRERVVLLGGPNVEIKDRKKATVKVLNFRASRGLKQAVRQ